jgi:hypothetical protein
VSFTAITLCVASQRVFIVAVYFVIVTQSGNFWIHPRIILPSISRHDLLFFLGYKLHIISCVQQILGKWPEILIFVTLIKKH